VEKLMNQLIAVSCALFLSASHALFAIETSEAVKVTPVLKASQSWDGALLQYPKGQAEITGVRIEIAPGGETGWHLHPVPSFGVMLQGQLEIKLKNGKKNVVKAGDALAEVVNTAHSGKNIGTEPVLLLIFYAGAVGQANSVSITEGN
jgi:quercetin dioxygenase-like cupin family protein